MHPPQFSERNCMSYVRPAEPKKAADPAVRVRCICRNGHAPIDGFIYTSPSCLKHGPRSPHVTHDGQSCFDVIWEEQDNTRQNNAKPVAHADSQKERLADAVGQCKKRMFADGAANTQPSNERNITMADTKATGQQTAAGFAQSNAPITSNNHQPFPNVATKGQIPIVNTAAIAPTTGPVPQAEQ